MHTYGRKPVEFVKGRGMHLYDDDGREYLDFIAGIGAVSMGHCHPAVTEAIQQQAAKLPHVGNYYYVENRGELAKAISELLSQNAADALGGSDENWWTFFANSGAEANEGAIKLARAHGNSHLDGATSIITAKHSFHGRTLATLFATGQPAKQEAFLPAVPGFSYVPLNDVDALVEAMDHPADGRPCAVMLECIQGEGGVNPCTTEYLQAVRELTMERGMLLIIDEVQTGFYRTGKPFAFQHAGIVPDIVTIAKGMGNGVPIGGFCARASLAAELKPGDHGTTYGGNALVCAASRAVLQAFKDQDIATNVEKVGAHLRAGLATLPHVKEVRGLGLMLAAQLDAPLATQVVDNGLEQGLVLNCVSADVLRFLPPLICTEEDVDVLIAKLQTILKESE